MCACVCGVCVWRGGGQGETFFGRLGAEVTNGYRPVAPRRPLTHPRSHPPHPRLTAHPACVQINKFTQRKMGELQQQLNNLQNRTAAAKDPETKEALLAVRWGGSELRLGFGGGVGCGAGAWEVCTRTLRPRRRCWRCVEV